MVRGAFVGGGQLEQALVVPHSSQKRDADWITAADESGGHSDLWQARYRALLACARLRSVSLEPALMGMGPRLIGGIQDRIERLLIHQVHEQLPERFAAGDESSRRLVERRCRRDPAVHTASLRAEPA